ncbi:MAG: class I SAM-dependent methyltransferase [Ignavibacteriales bacterium]|jgi:2-polyprenyl-3-methyl-5-hydroxy-6-metoxy-1,4-benzoquinol methylase|nr:MAG: class I SAM-dependent methyltransferase [Ignavibacteriales bacterium]
MAEKHFFEQIEFTNWYLIPYFKKHIDNFDSCNVLEVGCAEGGFVKVLHDRGIKVKGLELEQIRVDTAKSKAPELDIIQADITDPNVSENLGTKFDLIVMRDVIEHIPNRDAAFKNLYNLLNDNGFLFITFPPRFSGFAGHQQNGKSFFKYLPYIQILPNFLIRFLGKISNQSDKLINHVIINYKIGLSINKFERFYNKYSFEVIKKNLFLFRPIYKTRFGVNPINIPNIPLFREILAFGCETLLKKKV